MITRISAVEGIYGKVKASTEALLAVARSREAAAARTQQAIDEATETIQAFTAAARAAHESEAAEKAARDAMEREAAQLAFANEQTRRQALRRQRSEAHAARVAEAREFLKTPVCVHVLKEDGTPMMSVVLCRGSCVEEALPKNFPTDIFGFVDRNNTRRIDDRSTIGSLLDLESSSSSSSSSLAAADSASVGEITLRLTKRVKEGRVYVTEVNRRLNKETYRQLIVEGFACSMLCMNQNGTVISPVLCMIPNGNLIVSSLAERTQAARTRGVPSKTASLKSCIFLATR